MQRYEHRFTAMGGVCRLRIDLENEALALAAITATEAEVRRLEEKYSRYLPDSLTAKINRAAGSGKTTPIDAETAALLHYADTLWHQSGGLFDPTSGVLRQVWNFNSDTLPDQAQLDALLPLISWQHVQWDAESVCLPLKGMEIDFGGYVKEYACDCAAGVLRSTGIEYALVDLAGDLNAIGPQADGRAWQIGIRHPRRTSGAIALIPLKTGALATSGDYERCLVVDGHRYGHILNPATGWPVAGLAAVSIMAEQCLVAGGAATIGMLKPRNEALNWLAELGLPWLGIDSDNHCHGSIKPG